MNDREAKQALMNALPDLRRMFAHAESELDRALDQYGDGRDE